MYASELNLDYNAINILEHQQHSIRLLTEEKRKQICSYQLNDINKELDDFQNVIEDLIQRSNKNPIRQNFDQFIRTYEGEYLEKYTVNTVTQPFITTLLVFLGLGILGIAACCGFECLSCCNCWRPSKSYSNFDKSFILLGIILVLLFIAGISAFVYKINTKINRSLNYTECEIYNLMYGTIEGEEKLQQFRKLPKNGTLEWSGTDQIIKNLQKLKNIILTSPAKIDQQFSDTKWIDDDYSHLVNRVEQIYQEGSSKQIRNPDLNKTDAEKYISLENVFGPISNPNTFTGQLQTELSGVIKLIKIAESLVLYVAQKLKVQAEIVSKQIEDPLSQIILFNSGLKNFESKIDQGFDYVEQGRYYFQGGLRAFFSLNVIIVFVGLTALVLYKCKLLKFSRVIMWLSWIFSIITMLWCLIVAIVSNVGSEVMVDACRVIQSGLSNQTYYDYILAPKVKEPIINSIVKTCLHQDGDIVKLFKLDREVQTIKEIPDKISEVLEFKKQNSTYTSDVVGRLNDYIDQTISFRKSPFELIQSDKDNLIPNPQIVKLSQLTNINQPSSEEQCNQFQDQWVLYDEACMTDQGYKRAHATESFGEKICLNLAKDISDAKVGRYTHNKSICSENWVNNVTKRLDNLEKYRSTVLDGYIPVQEQFLIYKKEQKNFTDKLWQQFAKLFEFGEDIKDLIQTAAIIIDGTHCQFFGNQSRTTADQFCVNLVTGLQAISLWIGILGIILVFGSMFIFLGYRWISREVNKKNKQEKLKQQLIITSDQLKNDKFQQQIPIPNQNYQSFEQPLIQFHPNDTQINSYDEQDQYYDNKNKLSK